jgi:hypothetical protein
MAVGRVHAGSPEAGPDHRLLDLRRRYLRWCMDDGHLPGSQRYLHIVDVRPRLEVG